jgi:hypothetical protein
MFTVTGKFFKTIKLELFANAETIKSIFQFPISNFHLSSIWYRKRQRAFNAHRFFVFRNQKTGFAGLPLGGLQSKTEAAPLFFLFFCHEKIGFAGLPLRGLRSKP